MDKTPFTISRTLDAPRELVWKVWTESDHLARWWGPKGCGVTVAKLDLRPGGSFHYALATPDGGAMWGLFHYREVQAPEKLVFLNSFSNAAGEITRAPFNEHWPLQMLSTIRFRDEGGRTTVSIEWLPYEATAEEWETFNAGRGGMTQGWSGTFDQLEAYLAETRA